MKRFLGKTFGRGQELAQRRAAARIRTTAAAQRRWLGYGSIYRIICGGGELAQPAELRARIRSTAAATVAVLLLECSRRLTLIPQLASASQQQRKWLQLAHMV
jgi:hypothetical protein